MSYVGTESMEHILAEEWIQVVVVQDGKKLYMQVNGNEKKYVPSISESIVIAGTNIFIGAIRDEIREKICPKCIEIPQMSFTLGYLNIDGNEVDLLSLPVLETTSKHYASRIVSLSDYYEEVSLPLGQELKLSCFYDKVPREKQIHVTSKKTYVAWLLLDKLLYSYGDSDFYHIKDNGRVSTISIASYISRNQIENVYSCHIHRYTNKSYRLSDRATFTFGIIVTDKNREFETLIWREWYFVCGIIIVCFTFILIWWVLEGIQEIRKGYGFYRLPEILNNDPTSIINFVQSKNGMTLLGGQQAVNEVALEITNNN
nr:uncharacterized protein LOC116424143 [Nomia melanderi]